MNNQNSLLNSNSSISNENFQVSLMNMTQRLKTLTENKLLLMAKLASWIYWTQLAKKNTGIYINYIKISK
jgi:hypothetical protein